MSNAIDVDRGKNTLYRRVMDAGHADENGNPCPRATATMASVGIACDAHGRDVCEACDPCTCGRCAS